MYYYRYLSIIILSILILGCGKKEKKEETVFTSNKKEAEKVEVLELEPQTFISINRYPGTFKAWDSFNIAAELGGTIEYMPYDVGDYVSKNKTVLKVNTETLYAQLKQLKVAENIAKVNFNRVKKLYDKGLTTQAQMDQVTFQKDNSEASINSLMVTLRKSRVKSPFDGYVYRRTARKGELAAPGVPILTLLQLDPIKFSVAIPEADIYKMSKGNIVNIKVDSLGRSFKGVIYRIGQVAKPGDHTVEIEIKIPNKKENGEYIFRPGMMAKADIAVLREIDRSVLPLDSLIQTEKGLYGFLAKDGVAEKIKIDIVATDKNRVLITKNLKKGEKLIVKGQHNLINGRKLNIVNSNKQKNMLSGYKIAILSCKADKICVDIIKFSEKLLKSEMVILDFFKRKEHYILAYKGDIPQELQKYFSDM